MSTRSTTTALRPSARPRAWGRLAGIGVAWMLVLVLVAGRVLRNGGSIVFWLGIGAAAVHLIAEIAQAAGGRNRWRNARKAVVLVLAVMVPVAFDPKTFDVFNLTKYTVVITGALVLGALWAVEWARQGRAPLWRNGLAWPTLALIGWTALCTLVSSNQRISLLGFYKSYDGLYAMLAFGLLLFAVIEALTVDDVKPALSVFYFAGGGLAVLYGILQLHDRKYGGKWDWVEWGEASFKGSSIWSTLGNPNHLAGFLALILPIGVVLLFVSTTWWTRGLTALIGAGALLGMIQTTTKGAFVGLLVALAVLAVLFRAEIVRRAWSLPVAVMVFLGLCRLFTQWLGAERTRGSFGKLTLLFTVPGIAAAVAASLVLVGIFRFGDRIGRPWAPLVWAGVAAIALAFLVSVVKPSLANRAVAAVFDISGNSTGRQRLELWKSAWSMAVDKPLFGFGPDTFRIPFASYQSPHFVGLYGPDQIANGPHNTFMNYLATLGFPGLLAFLSILFYAALRAVGAWRRLFRIEAEGRVREQRPARDLRYMLMGAMAASVAYLGQASFNVQQIALSFCFWLLIGLIAVIALDVDVPLSLRPARLVARAGFEVEVSAEPRSLGAAAKKSSRPRRGSPPPRKKPASPASTPRPSTVRGTGRAPVRSARDAPRRARHRGRARPADLRATVTALAALAVVGVVAWFASGPYRADHSYRVALIDQNRAQAVGKDRPAEAQTYLLRSRQQFENAIGANPWEVAYIEASARLQLAIAQSLLQPQGGGQPNTTQALESLRDARSRYERAVALQPRNPYVLGGYAEVLLRIQEVDSSNGEARPKAVDALRRAADANPYQPRFPLTLSTVLANQNDAAGALAVLEGALTYQPNNSDLLRNAAKLASQLGDKARADAYWERLYALNPADQEAATALGRPVTPTAESPGTVSPTASR